MSVDAFGNSPAMSHAELVADGLIDNDGELTPKGVAAMIPAPSVPGEGQWSWTFMRNQFPKRGTPGITYTRQERVLVGQGHTPSGDVDIYTECDSLTLRNNKGRLVAVLSHWPNEVEFGGTVLEHAGSVSVWVDPQRRRRGLALRLLAEADRRFNVDWQKQSYTTGGWHLVTKYLQQKARTDDTSTTPR